MALITLAQPIVAVPEGYQLVVDVGCSDPACFSGIGGWRALSILGGTATLTFDLAPNDPAYGLSEADYLTSQREEVRRLIEYALSLESQPQPVQEAGSAGETL